MSKYGTGIYGLAKYGEREVSRTYYSSGIRSWSYGFNSVSLLWGSITPDPADLVEPTHWRLIRSFAGIPDNPFDGDFLDGDVISSFRITYLDTDIATDNRQVNYSIWVFNGDKWIFCGDTNSIVVQETNTLTTVSNWLPRTWLNVSEGVGDATGEVESNDLTKTLSAFTFTYDKFAAEAQILQRTPSSLIHNTLLKTQVTDLGFNYEPSLGDSYHRSLYRAGNSINSSKGTATSVAGYVTGLTHLGAQIKTGHNLMLDYNDSSFEESSARWYPSRGTVESVQFANSATVLGTAITAPEPWLTDGLYPPRKKGFGVFTVPEGLSTVLPATLQLPRTSQDMTLYGIPVKQSKRYLFSGWFREIDGNSYSISVKIVWYNYLGETIATTDESTPINSSDSWEEFLSKSDAGRNGLLAPFGATYASVELTVLPDTLSETKVLLDMLQLAEAKYSLEFEDARRVRVYLQGSQENLLPNPNFEEGVGGWYCSDNASLAHDPSIPSGAIFYGSSVMEVTALDSNPMYVSSDWFAIDPGRNYTFSVYLSTHYPNVDTAVARIEFSNKESLEQQTRIMSDVDGDYYDSDVYYVDSDPITLSCHTVLDENGDVITDPFEPGNPPQYVVEQQRISVTAIAPAYTRDSGNPVAKVSLYFPNCNLGETVYIDSAMLQVATTLRPFFDGSGAPDPEDPVSDYFFSPDDCVWEYKNVINLIQEPSFESILTWDSTDGTLTVDPGPGTAAIREENPDGTYGGITPTTYTPKYGNNMGKFTYDPLIGGEISTEVVLPSPAIGGEDFVVSAYVRAAEGIYTVTLGDADYSTSTRVFQHDQYQWIRISSIRQLSQGETSFIATIRLDPPPEFSPGSGPGYTIAETDFFHIDGVQAEYGRVPSVFLNPLSTTTKLVPISGTSNVMSVAQISSSEGGKSSYFPNYGVKMSRLRESLDLVMPHGSSWCVKPGLPTENYPDLSESLILSASFEQDLGDWVGDNSNLRRKISRGSYFGEYVSHGAAFCAVTTGGTNTATKDFGITSGVFAVVSGQGYYTSVAIRPANEDSLGTYTIRATFYTATGTELPVYIQDPAFPNDPTALLDVTDEYREKSFTITHTDRWAYLSSTYPAFSTLNAVSAKLTVTFTPDTFNSSQAFDIDRAVFRE